MDFWGCCRALDHDLVSILSSRNLMDWALLALLFSSWPRFDCAALFALKIKVVDVRVPEVRSNVKGTANFHIPYTTISRNIEVVVELESLRISTFPLVTIGLHFTWPYRGTFAYSTGQSLGSWICNLNGLCGPDVWFFFTASSRKYIYKLQIRFTGVLWLSWVISV